MRKILMWQSIILIILFCGIPILSQETRKISSVNDFATTQVVLNGEKTTTAANDCESDLQTANARLNKTLDALEKAESAIKSLQSEIEARRRLDDLNDQIIKAKDAVISEQAKLINILRKQNRRKISIIFGLVKLSY